MIIELCRGEESSGAIIEEGSNKQYVLVLSPIKPPEKLNWHEALKWAKKLQLRVPNNQEHELLSANLSRYFIRHLEEEYWSSTVAYTAGGDYCYAKNYDFKRIWIHPASAKLNVVGVRRIPLN